MSYLSYAFIQTRCVDREREPLGLEEHVLPTTTITTTSIMTPSFGVDLMAGGELKRTLQLLDEVSHTVVAMVTIFHTALAAGGKVEGGE